MKKLYFLLCLITLNFQAQNLGSLDTSFGINGMTEYLYSAPSKGYYNYGMQITPTNKIISAGRSTWGCTNNSSYEYFFVRFNLDGTPDSTFGVNGAQSLSNAQPYDIQKLQNSNNYYYRSGAMLKKIDENGLIDPNFSYAVPNSNFFMYAETPTDDIIVVRRGPQNPYPVIDKINSNGTINTSFGVSGTISFPQLNNCFIEQIIMDSSGNYYFVGRIQNINSSSNYHVIVIKTDQNGNLITTFANNGIYNSTYLLPSSQSEYYPINAHTTNDNGIIIISRASQLRMEKLTDTGQLSTSFSNGIKVTPSFFSSTFIFDNKLYLFNGSSYNGSGYSLTRYNLDGNLDSSYNNQGSISFPAYTILATTSQANIQDGKIVIAENVENSYCAQMNWKLIMKRYYFDSAALSTSEMSHNDIITYPNPVNNYLYLQHPKAKKIFLIEIYSTDGKLIRKFLNPNRYGDAYKIYLGDIQAGNYFLKVTNESQTFRTKIIKK
ncbi:T9SS type A sorting domain-containing protein [Kaistella sp. PBT33-4]|uniref:T9SS type A sorting domain-containing protein n=1 Tax=Kaistella sp. PBT33-4 TaxID=3032000 RepID=UPI0023D7CCFD|nr:T9SS type A sorting domain-containing protein [Kaistella sp. PBT33-4]MDF0718939.1 T9SS type A sorting domain-containing protein [Kaistella sp. PBT33-4]